LVDLFEKFLPKYINILVYVQVTLVTLLHRMEMRKGIPLLGECFSFQSWKKHHIQWIKDQLISASKEHC
jgi:hypothetical protein